MVTRYYCIHPESSDYAFVLDLDRDANQDGCLEVLGPVVGEPSQAALDALLASEGCSIRWKLELPQTPMANPKTQECQRCLNYVEGYCYHLETVVQPHWTGCAVWKPRPENLGGENRYRNVYVWDSVERAAYATWYGYLSKQQMYLADVGLPGMLGAFGSEADMQKQIAAQPWWNSTMGFPPFIEDPIPF